LIKKYGHHAVTVAIGGCIAALATFYTETRTALIELQSDRITNEARLMTLEEKLQAKDQILFEKLQTIDGKVDALAQIIDEVHPRQ
jgi:predicted ATPase